MEIGENCESIERDIIDSWVGEFFYSSNSLKKQISKEDIDLFLQSLRDKRQDMYKDHAEYAYIKAKLQELTSKLSDVESRITLILQEMEREDEI